MKKVTKEIQELVEDMLKVAIKDMAEMGYTFNSRNTLDRKIKWFNGSRTLGTCKSYITNNNQIGQSKIHSEITLSRHLINGQNNDQLISTIYHEVAHAFSPKDGHKGLFVEIAKKLLKNKGINIFPENTTRMIDSNGKPLKMKKYKYVAICTSCGKVAGLWKNKSSIFKNLEKYQHSDSCHGQLKGYYFEDEGVESILEANFRKKDLITF